MDDEEILVDAENDDDFDAFGDYLQRRNCGFDKLLTSINSEYGCDLRITCGACPVQIEGTIDGLFLYFRARWDTWSLAIADTFDQAVRAIRSADAVFYHESCAGLFAFDASWMELEQVEKALYVCLSAYRQGQKNGGYIKV